jgi:hypothetical protein
MTNAVRLLCTFAFASVIASALTFATASTASTQQSFKTSEAAVDALVSAARSNDRKALMEILGRGSSDIVSSGDAVADTASYQRFVSAYDAKHQLVMEGDNKAVLIVGQQDYPLPIPIVQQKGTWRFDTDAGRDEIIYRRIGRNELDTMQTSLAYVDAQNEYADKDRTGAGKGIYAQHFVSSPGKKDGLYWPDVQGEDQSPLGELAAEAAKQGYRVGAGRMPYHGYYYKILTKQGPAAPGGALDYLVNGKMMGGFALVAYPAQYRNSGVMTFIVNHNGQVYQKDLGPNTTAIAEKMTSFNPDKTWEKTEVTAPVSD